MKIKEIPVQMQGRIYRMMNRTWDAIGADTLECSGIPCDSGKTIPRSHVIEIVCDADHMAMYGNDKEAYEIFKQLSYPDKLKMGKIAFSFKRYGW